MRNLKKIIALLVIISAWLLLMWRLSSADGTETLHDSMRLTKKLAAWFYHTPTSEQLNQLNLILRKMAHVFLYAVLGLMSGMFWHLLLERCRIWVQAVPAWICCTAIAFLDELQKIPIDGRHFSAAESMLNAMSAAAAIFIFSFIIKQHTKMK